MTLLFCFCSAVLLRFLFWRAYYVTIFVACVCRVLCSCCSGWLGVFLPLSCVRVVLAGLVCLACSNICPVTCPFPVLILLFLFFLYTQLMCCCVHIRRCVFAVFLPVFVLVSCCPFAPPASFAYFILGLKGPCLFPPWTPRPSVSPALLCCFVCCAFCVHSIHSPCPQRPHVPSNTYTYTCTYTYAYTCTSARLSARTHELPPSYGTPTHLPARPQVCIGMYVWACMCMDMHV